MGLEKICPCCGSICHYTAIVPMCVYGYKCTNCGRVFDIVKIQIGW